MISVDNLIELLSRIQEQFHTKTSITSSHLIGNNFYNSNDIYSSLANLNQISDFRFLYGYNSIVCQNTLNTDCNVAYPQEIVHDIIKTIIYSTPTQCLEYMDNFIYSVISHNSPRLAREWIASMMFSLIKETQYMYNNSSANGFSYLKQILDCTTIDECIIHIQNMFPEIALIRPPKKVLPGDIFKHQVATIIANEYMNQDMNITYVAEKLNLVPAYFGQKFTKEYGTPFNAYLNNYRITCSMKLLSGTNDNIADIALQCGFSNASYFTKAFRAHTNMTPSQYRSKRM